MGQLFLSGDASAAKDRAHKRCPGKRALAPPQTQRTLSSSFAFGLLSLSAGVFGGMSGFEWGRIRVVRQSP